MTAEERFWAKIDRSGECWIWTGAKTGPGPKTRGGYGQFSVDRRKTYTHRFSYELHVGPIPEGLVIDHLCRVPACANPAHLEPVTNAENMRRGNAPSAIGRRTGLCKYGHSLADAWCHPVTGKVIRCRTCQREATLKQTPSAINHRAGLCKNGHPRSDAYLRKSDGSVVYCRTCRREKVAA